MLNLFIENFILIFVAIDPVGLLPIFAPFTKGLTKSEVMQLTLRSGFTAFFVLLAFWCFGSTILYYMGISIDSFKIIGGLFLFVIAYQMLFEQRQDQRQDTMDKAMRDKALSSLATFPIAIPLISGPGAIAITMLMQEKIDAVARTADRWVFADRYSAGDGRRVTLAIFKSCESVTGLGDRRHSTGFRFTPRCLGDRVGDRRYQNHLWLA